MKCFPRLAQLAGKDLRIQAEEHHQDTPDGPNVDLFTSIHHKVVALREKVNAQCIDGKVDQPLVLYKKPQNYRHTQKLLIWDAKEGHQ